MCDISGEWNSGGVDRDSLARGNPEMWHGMFVSGRWVTDFEGELEDRVAAVPAS